MSWTDDKKAVWVDMPDTDHYEDRMGDYACGVDSGVVTSFLSGCESPVLDMPCGGGRFTRLLSTMGYDVVGGDYSASMINTAVKRSGGCYVHGDVFRLPFKSGSFSTILTMRLVFHYFQPVEILAEAHRVLRPGGVYIFDTLNRYSVRYFIDLAIRLFRREGKRLWFITPKAMKALLESSGFEVVDSDSAYALPSRAYRWLPRFFRRLDGIWPESVRTVTYWKVRERGTVR